MKKLSEVTFDDAKAILDDAYGLFFVHGGAIKSKPKWLLADMSDQLEQPAKFFYCDRKHWCFWFKDDEISIATYLGSDFARGEHTDEHVYDVKLSCYLKAHELGYNVPGLSDKINGLEAKVKDMEDTLGGVVVESSGMYLTKTIDVTGKVIDQLEQNVSDLEVLLSRLFGAYVINIDESGFPKASLQELLDLHAEVSHIIKTGNAKKN